MKKSKPTVDEHLDAAFASLDDLTVRELEATAEAIGSRRGKSLCIDRAIALGLESDLRPRALALPPSLFHLVRDDPAPFTSNRSRPALSPRYLLPTGSRRQDSGDAEHVSIDPDSSARHSWHGITLEAGSPDDLGIRGFVEADHRFENLPAIRQMPGGSLYLKLHVETRGCSRWPRAVEKVQLQIRSIRASWFS